jgi:DNA (cytosine-5)-methyltransferase 1
VKVLDLFSGIGGFSLGLERAGMQTVAFCEIDPFCRKVLAKHWPNVRQYEDVRTLTTDALSRDGISVDVICGGFPCQDVSLAGKRAGVAGEHSGLYREMVRAIRMVRPKFAIMENVAALLGNGMGRILGDVAEDGYDAEWDCISASDVGAPHGRDRVWIALADAYKFVGEVGRGSALGWWLWRAGEVEAARNANGVWQLQPPRLLGDIRRRLNHAIGSRVGWLCDWETEFEAFRRMDDGLSDGLDRAANAAAIKALGNTLIPQIPEIIGKAIMAAQN